MLTPTNIISRNCHLEAVKYLYENSYAKIEIYRTIGSTLFLVLKVKNQLNHDKLHQFHAFFFREIRQL